MESLNLKEKVQLLIKKSIDDPLVKILAKNSHLTRVQLETLLINILSESISGKKIKYEEKAKLRLTKSKISRGSFNRTLKQAEENVIKSIYTILLLGYLGIFESASLDPYIEASNKIREYVEAHKNMLKNDKNEQLKEQLKLLKMLREELEESLNYLSKPLHEK
ncbi:MAG: hypothetical protein QW056_01890 [Candidatus Bathyarchaeia archaeon]